MQSTLNPKQTDDPHDFVVVAPDAVRVAPADEELSSLLQEAARLSSKPQTHAESELSAGPPVPPVDTTFRPADVNNVQVAGHRRSIGGGLVRAFTALLLAACIGVAAISWQSSGNVAKQIIAKWAPKFVLTSLLPVEQSGLPAQPAPPAVEAAAANAAPPQPASPAPIAPEGVAPTAAVALPAESAQLLQSMARDLASVGQEVEQLKASIEQLKAGQQQMSRDVAKASERSRIPAPPQRSTAATARRPMPAFAPTQAAAVPPLPPAAAPYVPRQPEPQPQPQVTAQPQAEPELSSVPRPPMPVR
jgi:hypothetical protein